MSESREEKAIGSVDLLKTAEPETIDVEAQIVQVPRYLIRSVCPKCTKENFSEHEQAVAHLAKGGTVTAPCPCGVTHRLRREQERLVVVPNIGMNRHERRKAAVEGK